MGVIALELLENFKETIMQTILLSNIYKVACVLNALLLYVIHYIDHLEWF